MTEAIARALNSKNDSFSAGASSLLKPSVVIEKSAPHNNSTEGDANEARVSDLSEETGGQATSFSQHTVAVFLTISILQAFIWGQLHKWYGYDFLAIPVPYISGAYVQIDGWSAIHVLCFIGCAALAPGRFGWLMFLGCVWELYENAAAGGSWLFLLGGRGMIREFWQERGINSAWDIWFNALGYRLGEILLFKCGVKAMQTFGKRLFIFGIFSSAVVAGISVYFGDITIDIFDIVFIISLPIAYIKLCNFPKKRRVRSKKM